MIGGRTASIPYLRLSVTDRCDRLMTDVPLWKHETTTEGARWIEARAGDHVDRARREIGS